MCVVGPAANAAGSENLSDGPPLKFETALAKFFMKFRGPQAHPNRLQETMVRPRSAPRAECPPHSSYNGSLIVTLTVNPALDHTLSVERLAFEDRSYIESRHESPGGRGINAACVIHAFGGQPLAIFPSGGKSGERFQKLVSGYGYATVAVPAGHEIRTNLTITDRQGLTVSVNERGPHLEAAEIDLLEKAVETSIEGAAWLMLCGSLPPGAPSDFYARLIEMARRKKVKTLLDTDGDALREGIEARPQWCRPISRRPSGC